MSSYSTPRLLTSHDDTSGFASGEPSLDSWLTRRAIGNQATGASRCFVTVNEGRVVGYYALSAASLAKADAPARTGRDMPDPVPVILLGRLAVDVDHQGQRLGSQLLRDAILRTVQAADAIGVRALLVHALHDEARRFYLRYDFEPSPTNPLHLLLLMKDARALLRRA